MAIIINLDVMLAKRKMTLTSLAEEIGMTLAALSRIKTNSSKRIRFKTLNRICDVLDCHPGDIIDRVDAATYEKLLKKPWVDDGDPDDGAGD